VPMGSHVQNSILRDALVVMPATVVDQSTVFAGGANSIRMATRVGKRPIISSLPLVCDE